MMKSSAVAALAVLFSGGAVFSAPMSVERLTAPYLGKTETLPMTRILRTPATQMPPRDIALASKEEWRAFWSEVHVGQNPSPPCPLEETNFEKEIVVAASLGQRGNGCYAIAIVRVARLLDGNLKGALLVSVEERKETGDCLCTMAIVHPIDVVRVPLEGKKPAKVFFERVAKNVPCGGG